AYQRRGAARGPRAGVKPVPTRLEARLLACKPWSSRRSAVDFGGRGGGDVAVGQVGLQAGRVALARVAVAAAGAVHAQHVAALEREPAEPRGKRLRRLARALQ